MLTPQTGATLSDSSLQDQYIRLEDEVTLFTAEEMSEDFGNAAAEYLKQGILLGGDLSAGGTLSILQNGFISNSTNQTATTLATTICNFLETNTTPGTPQVGSTVQSVTINANVKISTMVSAILNIVNNPPITTGWLNFYNVIDPIVKTIECTIIELVQPGSVPTPFIRFIS